MNHICRRTPVTQTQTAELRGYLAWLATDYMPVRFSGSAEPLHPKTIRNVWISLSGYNPRSREMPGPTAAQRGATKAWDEYRTLT